MRQTGHAECFAVLCCAAMQALCIMHFATGCSLSLGRLTSDKTADLIADDAMRCDGFMASKHASVQRVRRAVSASA